MYHVNNKVNRLACFVEDDKKGKHKFEIPISKKRELKEPLQTRKLILLLTDVTLFRTVENKSLTSFSG